ncbi:hypothetical protein GUITHDRAFT_114803 [Guillardia theta CCMP2712]|uniref:Uncharacterized protein n=1 Tax=Guillardia theta (strain CCMP2712) TaxID=905079 RepID=L1ITI4_GUITC|nr:hypothetical protein GUITHDRAFT_114803 [Guillardia theta CCMP2712]EKX39145.1 hypothetical protein GUITHDRAFT_114803 [Guillardia theta CCMP2712]|eukprot:XP_005826125.1 hypothetical protein GUITHDRAFT_114803 [Guillardia theta CCMP2712]
MLSWSEKAKREEVGRVEIALNELAIISEDEWIEMGLLGKMDLVMPFSLKKIRHFTTAPQGRLDWRIKGQP